VVFYLNEWEKLHNTLTALEKEQTKNLVDRSNFCPIGFRNGTPHEIAIYHHYGNRRYERATGRNDAPAGASNTGKTVFN
jgi:hypothetical protein